jgi:hypothetical protein
MTILTLTGEFGLFFAFALKEALIGMRAFSAIGVRELLLREFLGIASLGGYLQGSPSG